MLVCPKPVCANPHASHSAAQWCSKQSQGIRSLGIRESPACASNESSPAAGVEAVYEAACGQLFQLGRTVAQIVDGASPLSGRREFRSFAALNVAWNGLVKVLLAVPPAARAAFAQLEGDCRRHVARYDAMHMTAGPAGACVCAGLAASISCTMPPPATLPTLRNQHPRPPSCSLF